MAPEPDHPEPVPAGPPTVYSAVFTAQRPSLGAKLALVAALLAVAGIVLVLVVPAILLALVVFTVAAAAALLRRAFAGFWKPNGVLDGRRNVRVIAREPDR